MSAELANHGASCKVCLEFARRQDELSQLAQSWKSPEFSPDFTLGVMAQLAEESSQKRGLGELLGELLHTRLAVPLPVGALAGFLFVVSLLMNLFLWNQEQPAVYGPANQGYAMNPIGVPTTTPSTVTVSNPSSNRPYSIPREWLGAGAGAFLLIPMVDLNIPLDSQDRQEVPDKEQLDEAATPQKG